MANIADLTVRYKVTGDAAAERSLNNITKKAASAQKGVSKLSMVFGGIGGAIKKFAGPLALVAGAAGLGLLIKRSLDTADAIAKTADKIGFSTTALQELKFAAGQSGVEYGALTSSLERFTKRIGEADLGQGAAAKTFKRLGIELRDGNGVLRDSDIVLKDVATAFGTFKTAAERSAAAAALFGREGVGLVNLFREGPEAIQKLRDQAQKLGIVLDESLLRNAEKAKDELEIMNQVIGVTITKIGISFAPLLIRLGAQFQELAPRIAIAAEQFTDFIGKVTSTLELKSVKLLRQELDAINSQTIEQTGKIQAVEERLAKARAKGKSDFINQSIIFELENQKKLLVEIEKTAEPINAQLKIRADLEKRIAALKKSAEEARKRAEGEGPKLTEAEQKAADAIKKRVDAQVEGAKMSSIAILKEIDNQERLALAIQTGLPAFEEAKIKILAEAEAHDILKNRLDLTGEARERELNALITDITLREKNQRSLDKEVAVKNKITEADTKTADLKKSLTTQLRDLNIEIKAAGDETEEWRLKQLANISTMQLSQAETAQFTALINQIVLAQKKLAEDDAPKTFSEGWKESFNEWQEDATNAAKAGSRSFEAFADAGDAALDEFLETGKINFKSFINDIIRDLARIQIRRTIGSIFGSLFLENGGVIGGREPVKAAKGVVLNKPTLLAGGAAIGGEAGPEGVMPLRRNSRGELGVIATGGASATANISFSPTINMVIDDTFSREKARQFGAFVMETLEQEQRPGGRLNRNG